VACASPVASAIWMRTAVVCYRRGCIQSEPNRGTGSTNLPRDGKVVTRFNAGMRPR